MPYKKTYKNKSIKSKAIANLKKLAYRSKITQKVASMTTSSVYLTTRDVNDIDLQTGALELSQDGTNLPLMAVSLFSIPQSGVYPQSVFQLKQNGYDFANVNGIGGQPLLWEFGGYPSETNVDTNQNTLTNNFRQMLLRYTNIKLLLWQHKKKDVKFTLRLVRFKDSTFDPNKNLTTSDTDLQSKRRILFYNLWLRYKVTNPLLQHTEKFSSKNLSQYYKVIWEKEYLLNEQLSTADQANYKQVKIFRKFDKVINYADNLRINTAGSINTNSDDVLLPIDVNKIPSKFPETKNNLFLIITANATFSEAERVAIGAESETNIRDKLTFDLAIVNKYTIPTN